MATTATEVQHGNMGAVRIWKWTLTDGETGDAIIVPEKADVSIQAYGTWGGATLTIQGSLIPDSTIDQFFGAKDGSNTLISLTVDGGGFCPGELLQDAAKDNGRIIIQHQRLYAAEVGTK